MEERPDVPPHSAQPGHHDPTYRLGGAAPSRSALGLRLALAVFGLVVSAAGAAIFWSQGVSLPLTIVIAFFAVVAAVDVAVILRRRAQAR